MSILSPFKSKEAKLKDAERKRKKAKIKAYRELQKKMGGDEWKSSATSAKDKRRREITRDSFNKQRRKSGEIAAKGMPDIAGKIKKSGDPALRGISLLKTKYDKGKDARAAGAFETARKRNAKLRKKGKQKTYSKGGSVAGQLATRGYGAARH